LGTFWDSGSKLDAFASPLADEGASEVADAAACVKALLRLCYGSIKALSIQALFRLYSGSIQALFRLYSGSIKALLRPY
jgi:hypothetical protein